MIVIMGYKFNPETNQEYVIFHDSAEPTNHPIIEPFPNGDTIGNQYKGVGFKHF